MTAKTPLTDIAIEMLQSEKCPGEIITGATFTVLLPFILIGRRRT